MKSNSNSSSNSTIVMIIKLIDITVIVVDSQAVGAVLLDTAGADHEKKINTNQ